MDQTYKLLLLDDSPLDRIAVRHWLSLGGLNHALVDLTTLDELYTALAAQPYDCLLLDHGIPGTDGLTLLRYLRETHPDLAIILLTDQDDRETAVRLIKAGASDFLVKSSASPALFSRSVRSSVRNARTEKAARLARDARDHSEQRYRSLAESIPLMVWSTDASLRMAYVNRRYTAFTGFDLAAANAEGGVLAGYHSSDVAGALACWATATAERGVFAYQHRQLAKETGTYRWQLSRAEPLLDEHGQVLQWVGTTTDIDEQKRREEQQVAAVEELERARGEAERLNRAKDEFLAVLSHELRTPLHAISGWIQVLRDGIESERALDSIARNARALTRLIEDLLDVSRIVSGKFEMLQEPVELTEVLRAACDSVLPLARERGVELRAAIPECSAKVHGDARRLQQVAWNLLANAIQSSSPGDVVWVHARIEGRKLAFRVKDSGYGIEPGFLPHIFERFRQEDSSRTRRRSGLGLGLSIVKQIVELLHGEIDARSDGPGKGAEFTVAFAVLEASHAAGAGPGTAEGEGEGEGDGALPPQAPLAGMSVLVADDDDDSREMLAFALARMGAKVLGVSSAEACRQAFARHEPDALVSDIGMPGEDGYALMESLRSRGARVFSVALTGYAAVDDRERARAAGFDVHLTKPVVLEQLVASLAHARGGDTQRMRRAQEVAAQAPTK